MMKIIAIACIGYLVWALQFNVEHGRHVMVAVDVVGIIAWTGVWMRD